MTEDKPARRIMTLAALSSIASMVGQGLAAAEPYQRPRDPFDDIPDLKPEHISVERGHGSSKHYGTHKHKHEYTKKRSQKQARRATRRNRK